MAAAAGRRWSPPEPIEDDGLGPDWGNTPPTYEVIEIYEH